MHRYRFAAICILPLATSAGLLAGGWWCWLGAAVYAALYLGWDELGPRDETPPASSGGTLADALLFAQVPLILLAWAAFVLCFAGVGGISANLGGRLGEVAQARRALATPATLVGAIVSLAVTISTAGTTTAHELVHRTRSRASMLAGRVLLAFILDAAFAIEHVYGHHLKVGTRDDPATARRGENVYRFILRSTFQGFRSAWAIERRRLARRALPLWSWHNRNLRGLALSLAIIGATAAIAGWRAMLAFLAAAVIAKAFLEIINYVEHYGLVRVAGTRIEARHSWDTTAPMSAAGMFNLGRHASHHMSARPYWALPVEAAAPRLPGGLMLSGLMALVPPLWFRKMDRRLARWDRELASDGERALLAAPRPATAR